MHTRQGTAECTKVKTTGLVVVVNVVKVTGLVVNVVKVTGLVVVVDVLKVTCLVVEVEIKKRRIEEQKRTNKTTIGNDSL